MCDILPAQGAHNVIFHIFHWVHASIAAQLLTPMYIMSCWTRCWSKTTVLPGYNALSHVTRAQMQITFHTYQVTCHTAVCALVPSMSQPIFVYFGAKFAFFWALACTSKCMSRITSLLHTYSQVSQGKVTAHCHLAIQYSSAGRTCSWCRNGYGGNSVWLWQYYNRPSPSKGGAGLKFCTWGCFFVKLVVMTPPLSFLGTYPYVVNYMTVRKIKYW